MATAYRTTLTWPTYSRQPARQLPPVFDHPWKQEIYPASRDDILDGTRGEVTYDAIVLENEHLKLTILPELGGKLFSIYDKNAKEDAVYVPYVIKPGLIAMPGAWIPGGIEFNFPRGHHVHTMSPVPCHIDETGPDEAAAVIHIVGPRTGMIMEVRISLRAGEARLAIDYRISNPTALSQRWYQWTNVGVLKHHDWRFFAKASWTFSGDSYGTYPCDSNGHDLSWCKNRLGPSDLFIAGCHEDFFGCYDYRRDHGLAHVSPWQQMFGKKYFTWGDKYMNHDSPGVFSDEGFDYLEIQSGPFETQGDFELLPAGEHRDYGEVWIPFAKLGGIEYADKDIIFHVRDGVPWVFAARNLSVDLCIKGVSFTQELKAGTPASFAAEVVDGDAISITVDGEERRSFTYPLEGKVEPNVEERLQKKAALNVDRKSADTLTQARMAVLDDFRESAVKLYREYLEGAPEDSQVRLELAEALWRTGAFEEGSQELKRLEGSSVAQAAAALLARRHQAEDEFLAPLRNLPEGEVRDLQLAERYACYGNPKAAWKQYRGLLRSSGTNSRVQFGVALYYANVEENIKKAVHHAEQALSLQPNDRDLLLELLPIFLRAGEHNAVCRLIDEAPEEIASLSEIQKYRLEACFELGRFEEAVGLVNANKLHSWEGSLEAVTLFVDSCSAVAEQAMANGDTEAVLQLAEQMDKLPGNLGFVRQIFHGADAAFWRAAVLLIQGETTAAQDVVHAALGELEESFGDLVKTHGKRWSEKLGPEQFFWWGMCARIVGDNKRLDQIIGRGLQGHRFRPKVDPALFMGIGAELQGDFKTAERLLTPLARTSRIAKLHLTAVRTGKRRGEKKLVKEEA